MAQQELGVVIRVAPSVLVTMLNPLEIRGYARCERGVDDRRRHVVILTDDGADHLAEAATAQRATESELFRMLGLSQLEVFTDLLALMRGLTGDHDVTVGGSDALERTELLVADADRRSATQPAGPGGLI
jgi:DNA-binding PadR family transcriptional regulator